VEGRPICCEMWPGNTADVITVVPMVKRMRERFRLRELGTRGDELRRAVMNSAVGRVF
jgi:hypothetical protein